jgi:hypothetical protein
MGCFVTKKKRKYLLQTPIANRLDARGKIGQNNPSSSEPLTSKSSRHIRGLTLQ